MILFSVISIAILFYICALATWTNYFHNHIVWSLQNYDFCPRCLIFFSLTFDVPPKRKPKDETKTQEKIVNLESKSVKMELIKKYRKELNKACSTFNVEELYAFGSILTDKFNSNSDIDFIVSILSNDPIEYAENYFELKFELEKIFNRKIDLLEQKAIRNKTFENLVNQKKMLLYTRRNQGVA